MKKQGWILLIAILLCLTAGTAMAWETPRVDGGTSAADAVVLPMNTPCESYLSADNRGNALASWFIVQNSGPARTIYVNVINSHKVNADLYLEFFSAQGQSLGVVQVAAGKNDTVYVNMTANSYIFLAASKAGGGQITFAVTHSDQAVFPAQPTATQAPTTMQCHRCAGSGKCSMCGGSGFMYGNAFCLSCDSLGSGVCGTCSGLGSLSIVYINGVAYLNCNDCNGSKVCRYCQGTGRGDTFGGCGYCLGKKQCPACSGKGYQNMPR